MIGLKIFFLFYNIRSGALAEDGIVFVNVIHLRFILISTSIFNDECHVFSYYEQGFFNGVPHDHN